MVYIHAFFLSSATKLKYDSMVGSGAEAPTFHNLLMKMFINFIVFLRKLLTERLFRMLAKFHLEILKFNEVLREKGYQLSLFS